MEKEFSNKNLDQNDNKKIKENISKIKIFFEKLDNIKYNFKCDWILIPVENLKEESLKNPNKLLIKNKLKNIFNFPKVDIFDGEKIMSKILYASFEGERYIPIVYNNPIINEIIKDTQKLNNNNNNNDNKYKYGYRVMTFYNLDLFEDNTSKTMILIIKTIDKIIEQNFKKRIEHFSFIIKEIYKDFIISVISSESPEFENQKIINIFKYLLYSYLKRYKSIYDENKINNQKQIIKNKSEFVNIVTKIKNDSIGKINSGMNNFKILYKRYQEDLERFKESPMFKKKKEEYINKNSLNILFKIFTGQKDIEEFEKTE